MKKISKRDQMMKVVEGMDEKRRENEEVMKEIEEAKQQLKEYRAELEMVKKEPVTAIIEEKLAEGNEMLIEAKEEEGAVDDRVQMPFSVFG